MVEELPEPPVRLLKLKPLLEPAMAPISLTSSISSSRSTASSVTSPSSSSVLSSSTLMVTVACVLSISGISAVPLETASAALMINNANAPINTTGLNRRHQEIMLPYTS